MKKISALLQRVNVTKIINPSLKEPSISAIYFDSRLVKKKSVFVAIRGETSDGHKFIEQAISKGAKAIICEEIPSITNANVHYYIVPDSHVALALIAQNFYDNPSRKLKLIGITGTNGKTTTATLLYKLFRSLGFHTALISTIENKIDDKIFPATHTTPNPVSLAKFLAQAVSKKCSYVFMECSSHAILQKRIFGLDFAGGIFTNLTLDHLDYHKTLKKYAEAKKAFFDLLPQTAFALSNRDDEKGIYMLSETRAKKYFYSIKTKKADFHAEIKKQNFDGISLKINDTEIKSKLVGVFNAYNILAVFSSAIILGTSKTKLHSEVEKLSAPAGRFEFIKSIKGINGIVDYAHTPDALENVLKTLRQICPEGSKIITIVGCGGDRDKSKRKIMGQIATRLSDYSVFTSDNPRTENPQDILNEIVSNLKGTNYTCIVDRANAIKVACEMALPGDTVLIAGKGHESYQIFSNKIVQFSDKKHLESEFENIKRPWLSFFKNKKITVMGLGVLGRGIQVCKFLGENDAILTVTDLKNEKLLKPAILALKKYKIRYVLGKHYLSDFENVDMVVKAAGVPLNSPYVEHATKHKIPVVMDASLFAKLIENYQPNIQVVGVTGTRGKSMTTALIYHILSDNKHTLKCNIHLGGNMRNKATLPLLNSVRPGDIVVLELDSWQCQGFGDEKISPNISVFTSFMPDHMNYYENDMERYLKDKSNIFKYQSNKDILILNKDMAKYVSNKIKSKIIIPRMSDVKNIKMNIFGEHNIQNASFAYTVASHFGLKKSDIEKSLKSFPGLEGRLQYLGKTADVHVINDNNSTTPEATTAGLEATKSKFKNCKIILIAGGSDKKLAVDNLAALINKTKPRLILMRGTGTEKLKEKITSDFTETATLKTAVKKAFQFARKNDVILFSPAFASFGLFKNEYDRNDKFLKIINSWK